MKIMLDGHYYSYELIRSKRKSMSIEIDSKGNMVVRAPAFVKQHEIEQIMLKRSAWIEEKVKECINKKKQAEELYGTDPKILYLGKRYDLVIKEVEKNKGFIQLENEKLLVALPQEAQENVNLYLKTWLVEQARRVIKERAEYYSSCMGEPYNRIFIKDQKTRWGSCSSKRNLNFNYRLVMAPVEIIDYVVVHELCHLRQMNHSKKFWEEVKMELPDYEIRKKWLTQYGYTLRLN